MRVDREPTLTRPCRTGPSREPAPRVDRFDFHDSYVTPLAHACLLPLTVALTHICFIHDRGEKRFNFYS